ncbi:MAG: ATP-binding protein [Bacillota bacterium]
MKLSVKYKLFIFMSGLIVFYVLLSWFLNSQLLGKYYLYNKKRALAESYKKIDAIYQGDPYKISFELEKLESMQGLHIVILSKNFAVKYNLLSKRAEWRLKRKMEQLPRRELMVEHLRLKPPPREEGRMPYEKIIEFSAGDVLERKAVIKTLTNSRMEADFISLIGRLKNGDILSLSTPVAAINESVQVANQFFLYTGLLVIITGSILIFVSADRFTKPLHLLSGIARRMSMLDFGHKYPVTTGDEIGELGASINSLSSQLEKSISELREANAKLKEDIERERRIDEMRKEFISNVSHELKTPIALIQGYAEGLKVNVNEDEENKNYYCGVIMDEANKMNKLVRQLLDLSHLESGFSRLDRSDFDLSFLVEQVLKKHALVLRSKAIKVRYAKEEDLTVNADYDRVEQVLMNYLNNAVNHVDDKRIIRVTIKRVNDKARVMVYNSGRHINEEEKKKIWASFYKADKSRTRDYGGSGLGLSIVKAIQDAHQNLYGLENTEGGVEFWFELNLANR